MLFCLRLVGKSGFKISSKDHNVCWIHPSEKSGQVLAEIVFGLGRAAITECTYRCAEKSTAFQSAAIDTHSTIQTNCPPTTVNWDSTQQWALSSPGHGDGDPNKTMSTGDRVTRKEWIERRELSLSYESIIGVRFSISLSRTEHRSILRFPMVPDRAPIRSIWIFVRVLDAAKLIEQVDLNNVSNFFPAVSLMLTPDKYSQVENIRGKTNDQHIGKMKPDKALSRNGAADILMTEHYRPPTMQKVFSLGNSLGNLLQETHPQGYGTRTQNRNSERWYPYDYRGVGSKLTKIKPFRRMAGCCVCSPRQAFTTSRRFSSLGQFYSFILN